MKEKKEIKLFILGVRPFGQFTPMAPVRYGAGSTLKRRAKRFHGIEYRTKAEKKAIKKLHTKFLQSKAA